MTNTPTLLASGERRANSEQIAAIWQFAAALLRASVKPQNRIIFGMSLGLPLFMMLLFWMTGGPKGVALLFPALVSLSVMLPGQTHAMRIVNWRQQGVFQRLACTPVPLGYVVLGASLAQVILSIAPAIGVALFGMIVIGLQVNLLGALLSLLALIIGGACFIAYGSMIAGLTRRPEITSALFIFTLLPMSFLGGMLPQSILPAFARAISPWLPTTMLTNIIAALIASGGLPDQPLFPLAGLLCYTLIFGAIGAKLFRLE